MNSENTLGIKLAETSVPAQVVMDIKKETGASLADIKTRISAGELLYVCSFTDTKGLMCINRLKRYLVKKGLHVLLYEDDEEEASEYFDNIEAMRVEMAKEHGYYDLLIEES